MPLGQQMQRRQSGLRSPLPTSDFLLLSGQYGAATRRAYATLPCSYPGEAGISSPLVIRATQELLNARQPGHHGSFGTMLSRDVVTGSGQLLRQVLLSRDAVRLVVGVGVVLPMSQPRSARIVSIPQVTRHQSDPAGVDVGQRRIHSL